MTCQCAQHKIASCNTFVKATAPHQVLHIPCLQTKTIYKTWLLTNLLGDLVLSLAHEEEAGGVQACLDD